MYRGSVFLVLAGLAVIALSAPVTELDELVNIKCLSTESAIYCWGEDPAESPRQESEEATEQTPPQSSEELDLPQDSRRTDLEFKTNTARLLTPTGISPRNLQPTNVQAAPRLLITDVLKGAASAGLKVLGKVVDVQSDGTNGIQEVAGIPYNVQSAGTNGIQEVAIIPDQVRPACIYVLQEDLGTHGHVVPPSIKV